MRDWTNVRKEWWGWAEAKETGSEALDREGNSVRAGDQAGVAHHPTELASLGKGSTGFFRWGKIKKKTTKEKKKR